jgi:hypothetical protein
MSSPSGVNGKHEYLKQCLVLYVFKKNIKYKLVLKLFERMIFTLFLLASCPGRNVEDHIKLLSLEKNCKQLCETAMSDIYTYCYDYPRTWETHSNIKQVLENLENECKK